MNKQLYNLIKQEMDTWSDCQVNLQSDAARHMITCAILKRINTTQHDNNRGC